jgi:hypothetical protein
MSKEQRPKYYKESQQSLIPHKVKKLIGKSLCFHNGILTDRMTGKPIVANSDKVGTPNTWHINGNDFVSHGLPKILREVIFRKMKAFLKPYVRGIKKPNGSIGIWLEYHYPLREEYDLDNHSWLWFKWFQDVLVESGVISTDSIMKIKFTGGTLFVPAKIENRKLVFHIQSMETLKVSWKDVIEGSKEHSGAYPKVNRLKVFYDDQSL